MSQRVKYLNGLAITSIVFLALSLIPLGILAGITASETQFDEQILTIDANGHMVQELNYWNNYVLNFWVEAGEDVTVSVYLLEDSQYDNWTTNELPSSFERHYKVHDKLLYLNDEQGQLVIYNNNDFEVKLTYYFVEFDQGLAIAMMVLGVIASFFITLLALHTVGFFIKYLIIVPISGTNGRDDYRRRRKSTKSRYYSYSAGTTAVKKAPTKSSPSTPQKKDSTVSPAAPVVSSPPVRPKKTWKPAIENISENYVVSKNPTQYTSKHRFVNQLKAFWENSDIPERVLSIFALFFFVLGIFTSTWFLIFGMPTLLMALATVVYLTSSNRREKVAHLVESYKALYVREIAQHLSVPYKVSHRDVWKIINLGLANIAYDLKNDVVFIPGIEKNTKTVTSQTKVENKKKVEITNKENNIVEGNFQCPFCDAINPDDSAFCIKCGASLQPAK